MATVGDITQQVSFDLNDQEPGFLYQRWPQGVLVTYLNDALRQIAIRRPDEMVTEVSLPLVAGERQQLPAAYLSIIDILSAQDDSCGSGARMTRGEWDSYAAFNVSPACTAPGTPYRGRDWFYNPNHPRVFFVYPPVPQGTTGSVTASVRSGPQSFTTSDLATQITGPGDKHLSAVIAWMKHRAYLLDSESSTAQAKSQQFLSEFREDLGISQVSDSRHLSGWNQGQRGEGDPQASRR